MRSTLNLPWLGHNGQRSYPLAETTFPHADVTGTCVIPDDFLLELTLVVPTAIAASPAGFYVSKLGLYATGISLVVAANGVDVAAALIPAATHQRYDSYRLNGLGDYDDITGIVVIGTLDSLNQQPPGQYAFNESATRLEVDCLRPSLRSITSLQVQNGPEISPRIYGDVVLRAGKNTRISSVTAGDTTTITFDAIEGAGLNDDCICVETTPPCIRTINGIPPDNNGNFTLTGNDCLTIEPITNGVQLQDVCSEPCCGCTELQTVVDALQLLQVDVSRLEQLAADLNSRTAALDPTIFASVLKDGGCRICGE